MAETFRNAFSDLEYDLTWLSDTAREHPQWLLEHPKEIYNKIKQGLNESSLYFTTVDTVLNLLPNPLKDPGHDVWFRGICELVAIYPQEVNTPFRIGFRDVMSQFHQGIGVYGAREKAAPEALEALLNAYINLFKVLNFSHSRLKQDELIDEAQDVARTLSNRHLTAKLGQTLALYYGHYGVRDLAIMYGKQAFSEYVNLYDQSGIADAACTLAILYRIDTRNKEADFYIQQALNAALEAGHEKQIATLFYEQGVASYREDDFKLAQTFYEVALGIFTEFEAVYQIAMTKQALSQVHAYLCDFERAMNLLLEARQAWAELEVSYEWVNTYFVESDIELLRGHKKIALAMMEDTIKKAKRSITDIPMREYLIDMIEKYIDKNRHTP